MASNSKIQWTDHTVNFWTGCTKVSPGCKYCYMYRDKERYGKDPSEVVRVSQKTINKVLKDAKPGDKIFTCSWSDFFIEAADPWRADAWKIIKDNPQFTWQILTKRPERINHCLPNDWGPDGYPNVWLGVSVESVGQVHRLNSLNMVSYWTKDRKYKTFVSYEPAIGPISAALDSFLNACPNAIDWVIIGGESGNDTGKYRYRPADKAWFDMVIDVCRKHGVKIFVKQMGTHLAKVLFMNDRHGGDINEWPEYLKIRELP